MNFGDIRNRARRGMRLSAALVLSLSLVGIGLALAEPVSPSQGEDGAQIYLPLILKTSSPAGVYGCNEYENGLIWTADVITLNADGTSVYEYYPPYPGIATGTWVYTPSTQEVGFTNFRWWLTATYESPGRLWARQDLGGNHEVALDCGRRESPPAGRSR